MYKKLLVILLMINAVMVFFLQSVLANEKFYSDLHPSHWAYTAVKEMKNKNIISGFPDGTFRPNDYITREQFAKLLVTAFNLTIVNPGSPTYKDINPKNNWSYPYVESVKEYLRGYYLSGQEVFKGTLPIRRDDVAVAVVHAKKITLKESNLNILDVFDDKDQIPGVFKKEIAAAVENNIMKGNGKFFNPLGSLTRAEACQLLYNALQAQDGMGSKEDDYIDYFKLPNSSVLKIEPNKGRNNSKCLAIDRSGVEQEKYLEWAAEFNKNQNKIYKITAYVKGDSIIGIGKLRSNFTESVPLTGTFDWKKIEFYAVPSSNSLNISIAINPKDNVCSGQLYIDDITIEEVNPTIEGQYVKLIISPDKIQQNSISDLNLSKFINYCDLAYKDMEKFFPGFINTQNKKITMIGNSFALQESNAYAIPPNFITVYQDDMFLGYIKNVEKGFSPIVLHEFAHVFESNKGVYNYYSWDSEFLANLAKYYIIDKENMNFIYATNLFSPNTVKDYEKNINYYYENKETEAMSDGAKVNYILDKSFMCIKNDIGWKKISEAFEAARDNADGSSINSLKKFNLFISELGKISGVDIKNKYFNNSNDWNTILSYYNK